MGDEQPSTAAERQRDSAVMPAEKAHGADRKSAIVIVRRRKHAMHTRLLDGLTVQRRGDAADELFREIVQSARKG